MTTPSTSCVLYSMHIVYITCATCDTHFGCMLTRNISYEHDSSSSKVTEIDIININITYRFDKLFWAVLWRATRWIYTICAQYSILVANNFLYLIKICVNDVVLAWNLSVGTIIRISSWRFWSRAWTTPGNLHENMDFQNGQWFIQRTESQKGNFAQNIMFCAEHKINVKL